ncbi:hypothetical protein RvY_16334 [Ramazzottius varieornatus]|uniref:Uncharacterized protein n=1 Tax=Ramazzottius varieornatus TaxID=947166 RepID=A0A1D1VY43_RAMVA|nr:hypothetical protein RvY_16334 [Ramazzottius varieornatus]
MDERVILPKEVTTMLPGCFHPKQTGVTEDSEKKVGGDSSTVRQLGQAYRSTDGTSNIRSGVHSSRVSRRDRSIGADNGQDTH